jgi:uncharacterized protein (TIGR03083 family)
MTVTLGPRLDAERYLSCLEEDGIALASASEGVLQAAVPGCPAWSVADLVWHVAEVHHFWGSIARRRLQSPEEVERPERPTDPELLEWYRTNLNATVESLREADPASEVWSWSPEKNVAWIRRRMAHETAVHRWDAQSAGGTPQPIAPDVAVDGIDEYLEFFIEEALSRKTADVTVHLHANDVEGEWFIEVNNGGLTARRAHEKGDVAVRGRASDILLLLWGRLPEANVEVHGDRAALFAFLQLADLS